ncbi:protein of unknown function [Pseudomonas sp. JV241A]|nr:protein of unknown function [Pseudomonas sp. JV241A]
MEVSLAGNDCWIHYKPRSAKEIRSIPKVLATSATAAWRKIEDTFGHVYPSPHVTYLASN